MKINLLGSSRSSKAKQVKEILEFLFPDSDVHTKSSFSLSELENSYVLELDRLPENKMDIARYILNTFEIGVSEKVLEKLEKND